MPRLRQPEHKKILEFTSNLFPSMMAYRLKTIRCFFSAHYYAPKLKQAKNPSTRVFSPVKTSTSPNGSKVQPARDTSRKVNVCIRLVFPANHLPWGLASLE